MDCIERTKAMPDRRPRMRQIDLAVSRYLRTCERINRRYLRDGVIVTHVGGHPTKAQRLLDMAWQRFASEYPD